MEQSRKKELKDAFKQRPAAGGVYEIRCANGRCWVRGDVDLPGAENRFRFSQLTGSCVAPALQQDWARLGPKSFTFAVLERLKKKDDQTDRQYREDVETLADLWREKYDPAQLY